MLRSSVCSFLAGAGVATAAGGYYLRRDIFISAGHIEDAIKTIRTSSEDSHRRLEERVAALEAKQQ